MPFDLTEKPIFQLVTKTLGLLNARDLVRTVERGFFAGRPKQTSSAEEAIRLFASLTLYRQSADPAEDTFAESNRITLDEAKSLTRAELDEFSQAYIENSGSLLREIVTVPPEKKEGDRNQVEMRFQRMDFPRKGGETPTEYLYRGLLDGEERHRKELQQTIHNFDATYQLSGMGAVQDALEQARKLTAFESPALVGMRDTQESIRKMAVHFDTPKMLRDFDATYRLSGMGAVQDALEQARKLTAFESSALLAVRETQESIRKMAAHFDTPKTLHDLEATLRSSGMDALQEAIEQARSLTALGSPALFAIRETQESIRKMAVHIDSPMMDDIRQIQEHSSRIYDLSLASFSAVAAEHARIINETRSLKFELPSTNYFEQLQAQIKDVSGHIYQVIEPIRSAISSVAESTFMLTFKESITAFKELPYIKDMYNCAGHVAVESSALKMLRDLHSISSQFKIANLAFPYINMNAIDIDGVSITIDEIRDLFNDAIDEKCISESDSLADALNSIAKSISELKEPIQQKILWRILVPIIIYIVLNYSKPLINFIAPTTSELSRKFEQSNQIALEGYGFVTADGLNVREQGNVKATIIGTLCFGNVVKIIDKRPHWYLIEWKTESCTLRGWASVRHIRSFQ